MSTISICSSQTFLFSYRRHHNYLLNNESLSWFGSLEVKTKIQGKCQWVYYYKSYLICKFLKNYFISDIKIDRLNWLKRPSRNPLLSSVFLIIFAFTIEGRPHSIFVSLQNVTHSRAISFSFIAFFLFSFVKIPQSFFYFHFCDLIYLSNFLWSGFSLFSFVCDVGWWLFWWKMSQIKCVALAFNP